MKVSTNKQGVLSLVLLMLALYLLSACQPPQRGGNEVASNAQEGNQQMAQTAEGEEEVEEVFAVNVSPVYQGELVDYLLVSGDVEVQSRVSIIADVGGDITDLYVTVGDRVRNRQVLMRVDPSKPGQDFEPRLLRSTISGTVVALPVEIGSTIGIGSRVADIAKTTDLEITVYIAERFVAQIAEGAPAVVRLDAFPDRSFTASVTKLDPILDPNSRTLAVTLNFTEYDPRLRAGMFALVKIITEQKANVIQVPARSVIYRFGKSYVYIVQDGVVSEREILPGIEIDGRIEVYEGVEAGELVVTQGQALLNDQTKVRIIQNSAVIDFAQEL